MDRYLLKTRMERAIRRYWEAPPGSEDETHFLAEIAECEALLNATR